MNKSMSKQEYATCL